jgi:hypothetical protein
MRQKFVHSESTSERIVKNIRRATRKRHSPDEKIRIVLDGQRGGTSIAELCCREGLAESLYCARSKEFLEAGNGGWWATRRGPRPVARSRICGVRRSKTGKLRKTGMDRWTLRQVRCAAGRRCRKRIEEVFGWIKVSAGLAKVNLRRRDCVDSTFILALTAYNLIRSLKLMAAAA